MSATEILADKRRGGFCLSLCMRRENVGGAKIMIYDFACWLDLAVLFPPFIN